MINRKFATLSGLGAIFIWCFTGVIAGKVTHIPLFQFLLMSQAMSFVATCVYIIWRKRWRHFKGQPLWFWIVSAVTITVSQLFYVGAFRLIPAGQVDVINYQWPMLLALATSILPGQRWCWIYLLGVLVGMSGVCCLFLNESFNFSSGSALLGSLFALGASLTWVVYCMASRFNPGAPPEMINLSGLVSVVVFTIFHFTSHETFISLNLGDWGLTMAWGILCYAIAFGCWDLGNRLGNIRLLALLSYITPVGSIAMLVLFGLAPATLNLLFAAIAILAGSVIGSYGPALLKLVRVPEPLPK